MLEPNKAVPSGVEVDPFIVQRLRQLTYQQLAAKGLVPAEREVADLVVAVHLSSRQKVLAERRWAPGFGGMYGYGYGYSFWPGGGGGFGAGWSTSVLEVEEDAVAIELIDRQAHSVVWRGVGTRASFSSPNDSELHEMIQRILSRFPPARASGRGAL